MKFLLASVVAGSLTIKQHFENFIEKYNKKYDQEEKEFRLEIFTENYKYIQKTNKKETEFQLTINEFADLTDEEFRRKYTPHEIPADETPFSGSSKPRVEQKLHDNIPEEVDWVALGAVTDVKNQGHCGSCWTFSTTGSVEGHYQIITGDLKAFAEQQFVDCAGPKYGNYGCNGGLTIRAFNYLFDHGLCTEEQYPYTAEEGECQYEQSCTGEDVAIPPGALLSYTMVGHTERHLLHGIALGPLSVSVEADSKVFRFYKNGVMSSDECGRRLNHAVLAVGYGNLDGVPYWKVKNSWSAKWGDEGYILLKRGDNECGIRTRTEYPNFDVELLLKHAKKPHKHTKKPKKENLIFA